MRIQHNILAMNAYRNYNTNTSAVAKNLEKLSSGYKINRAGDDAAGLAISEKMRAQITGLQAAQKNVKDGISLVKTAEGAMQEVQDMLNRMVSLASQSANGTYDNEVDRDNLQKEVDQLRAEINRIADSANFNGIKLLDGTMNGEAVTTQKAETFEGSTFLPPANPSQILGTDTVLNKDTEGPTGTSFAAILGNVTFANDEGSTFELKVGDDVKLSIDGDGKGEMDAAAIAKALEAKYKGDSADNTVNFKSADGSDQAFTVKADGNKLIFTQKTPPVTEDQVVDAPKNISFSKTGGAGTPGEYTYKIDTAFAAGESVRIGGKDIKFFNSTTAGTSGNIDVNSVTTAAAQATAIKNLFDGDATWTVTDDGSGTLTFTQKVADAQGALQVETLAAGDPSGAVDAPVVGTEYDAGTSAVYSFTLAAQPDAGETLTVGGKKITFVAAGQGDAAEGRVERGADAKATAANIATYLNGLDDFEYTVTSSDSKLTFTQKIAGTGTLANPNTGYGTNANKPVMSTETAADGTAKGKWKLDFNASNFKVGDTVTIAGKTIKFAAADDLANGEVALADTNAATVAAAVHKLLSDTTNGIQGAVAGKYSVTDNGDGTISIEQAVASATADILNEGGISVGTVTTTGGTLGTAQAANAMTVSTDQAASAATPASWTMKLSNVFAAGDELTLDDGNGHKFEIKAGSGLDIDTDTATNAEDQAAAIVTALGGTFGDFTVTSNANGELIFTQTKAMDPAVDGADGSKITAAVEKSITGAGTLTTKTEALAGSPGGDVVDYLVDTSLITQGSVVNGKRLASTIFKLDDIVKDGNTLKIADQKFTFKVGADSTTEAAEGATLIDLSNVADSDILREAAIQLTNLTKTNSVFESGGFDGSNITFLEKNGQSAAELNTFEKVAEQFSYSTAETTAVKGSALTLQIGDTSDDYNQLKVNIGDMHTKALGIDGISIKTQAGAAAAVDVIKNAINQVSSIRGTLGATQNRLEHTANNLSVMTENIQDAESTIRDTDIAEEMMAYTKNNILVQSAQAMLAQANQIPQGVLQLLG